MLHRVWDAELPAHPGAEICTTQMVKKKSAQKNGLLGMGMFVNLVKNCLIEIKLKDELEAWRV